MTVTSIACSILLCLSLLHAVNCDLIGCATTDVNIRSGPSTKYSKQGLLKKSECLAYEGLSTSRTWAKVSYNGRDRWIYKKYLSVKSARGKYDVCGTTNVNVRSGAGTSNAILGTLRRGNCVSFRGLEVKIGSLRWTAVYYSGKRAYVATKYTIFKPVTKGSNVLPPTTRTPPSCPRIISRAEWNAKAPKGRSRMSATPDHVYIHHGTGSTCTTISRCSEIIRGYQRYHMNTKGWSDIGYSFLVGEDGNVYEGRGWKILGGHTRGHNDQYGICVIGDFSNRRPNQAAQQALRSLIQCGVSKGYIKSNYVLQGHRDVGKTACPGQSFYNLIKTWPHYG